jgi:hypothetical protein
MRRGSPAIRLHAGRMHWRSAQSIDKMRCSLGGYVKSVCIKSRQQWKWAGITGALVRDRLDKLRSG